MLNIARFTSKNRTGTTFIILIGISLVLMVISTNAVTIKPKKVGFAFVSVVQKGFSRFGQFFSGTVNSIEELRVLRAEYDIIQKELESYKYIEQDILELRQENEQLRKLVDFTRKVEYKHVPAEIIGKDPGNVFNTLIINKGTRDGIKENMPVITYQAGYRGLVGKVIQAGPLSSQIKPIFDRTCYVASRLQNGRYDGLISGSGYENEMLVMQYVKKHARDEIKYGDIVITSGMNSLYPKGIYIGRIRGIRAKEYEPSLELDIEALVDFSTLEYVFVLEEAE